MKMNHKLILNHVTKMYDKDHGIKSISTEINCGEIVAFIGPNGVGKTTLVKTIAGLSQVTKGEIILFGMHTSSQICKPKIGYMQNDLGFYDKMTIYEVLDFICLVKFDGKYRAKIDIYLKKYNLYEQRNSFIGSLSLGMKRKLSIIMALIGKPALLILDEPTNGVDTHGIIQLKNDLLNCLEERKIVIITSHVLDWVEKIATRCIFL